MPTDILEQLRSKAERGVQLADVEQVALAKGGTAMCRHELARRQRKLCREAAGILADDNVADVRCVIALRADIGADLLERMSHDTAAYVRSCVAQNVKAPPALLAAMAEDEDEGVRKCVADNDSVTVDTLAVLSGDVSLTVRRIVRRKLDRLVEVEP